MNLRNNELNNLKNAYKSVHGIWLGGKVCDYAAKTSKDGFLMWLTNIDDSVILAIPAWLNDQSQDIISESDR